MRGRRGRYLQECLELRAPPDVWFLASPASTAAGLRGCLLPRAPSAGSVCRVRGTACEEQCRGCVRQSSLPESGGRWGSFSFCIVSRKGFELGPWGAWYSMVHKRRTEGPVLQIVGPVGVDVCVVWHGCIIQVCNQACWISSIDVGYNSLKVPAHPAMIAFYSLALANQCASPCGSE